MNSVKLVSPFHVTSRKNSFSDISRKCIWPNMIRVVTALIIFGKIHFLLISEKEFFHEIKRDGITSFMEFMQTLLLYCRGHENTSSGWKGQRSRPKFESGSHDNVQSHQCSNMFSSERYKGEPCGSPADSSRSHWICCKDSYLVITSVLIKCL